MMALLANVIMGSKAGHQVTLIVVRVDDGGNGVTRRALTRQQMTPPPTHSLHARTHC